MGMVKLSDLFDKFNIKIVDGFPQGILDIELDYSLNDFNKGYKNNNRIIFKGDYDKKLEDSNGKYSIKVVVNPFDDIDYDLLSKLELYNRKHNKDIWDDNDEVLKGLMLLDKEYVMCYVSSKDIPTAFRSYNILGGLVRHS